jgi:hypothetical protein
MCPISPAVPSVASETTSIENQSAADTRAESTKTNCVPSRRSEPVLTDGRGRRVVFETDLKPTRSDIASLRESVELGRFGELNDLPSRS